MCFCICVCVCMYVCMPKQIAQMLVLLAQCSCKFSCFVIHYSFMLKKEKIKWPKKKEKKEKKDIKIKSNVTIHWSTNVFSMCVIKITDDQNHNHSHYPIFQMLCTPNFTRKYKYPLACITLELQITDLIRRIYLMWKNIIYLLHT